jgi:hypothetical protein
MDGKGLMRTALQPAGFLVYAVIYK